MTFRFRGEYCMFVVIVVLVVLALFGCCGAGEALAGLVGCGLVVAIFAAIGFGVVYICCN